MLQITSAILRFCISVTIKNTTAKANNKFSIATDLM